MKKIILLLTIFVTHIIYSQVIDNNVVVKFYDFVDLDENVAIIKFDKEYKNLKISEQSDNLAPFFILNRYKFVDHILDNYKIKTDDYLSLINYSKFVCGLGLKNNNIDENPCKEVVKYVPIPEKITIAEKLIKLGEKPLKENFESCLFKNDIELFKLYNKHYGNIFLEKEYCEEMLVNAADFGYIDFIKYFLSQGVSINGKQRDFPAFFRTVNKPELFNFFLDNGADIQVENEYGNALMQAGGSGCTTVIKILLNKGLDPNKKYKEGNVFDYVKKSKLSNKNEILNILKPYKK